MFTPAQPPVVFCRELSGIALALSLVSLPAVPHLSPPPFLTAILFQQHLQSEADSAVAPAWLSTSLLALQLLLIMELCVVNNPLACHLEHEAMPWLNGDGVLDCVVGTPQPHPPQHTLSE